MPRVAEIPLDTESFGKGKGRAVRASAEDPCYIESSGLSVNGRSPDDVPTASTKQQPIRTKQGVDHLFFGEAVVANSERQLGIDRSKYLLKHLFAVDQRVGRRHLDMHRPRNIAEILANGNRQRAFQLERRRASISQQRQTVLVAKFLAQNDQGQGLLRREIRRREEAIARQAKDLIVEVELNRNPRLAEDVQISEYCPATNLAFKSKRTSCVAPTTLQQID